MRTVKEELLTCDKHTVSGRIAGYKLTKLIGRKDEYLIWIYYGRDKAAHRICGKIDYVLRIYRIVEKNSVTPCTLSDVIKDITYPCEQKT